MDAKAAAKAEKEAVKAAKKAEKEEAKRKKAEEKARKAEEKAKAKEEKKKGRKSTGGASPETSSSSPAADAEPLAETPEVPEPTAAPAATEGPAAAPATETDGGAGGDNAAAAEPTAEPANEAPAAEPKPKPEPEPEPAAAPEPAAEPEPEPAAAPEPAAEPAVAPVAAPAEPAAAPAPVVTASESAAPAPVTIGFAEEVGAAAPKRVSISRSKSARRSIHGAPTPSAAGVTVIPSESPTLEEPEETGLGTEVVEDECDEVVGQMASVDAIKTAEFLKGQVELFKAKILELQAGGTNQGYSRHYNAMAMLGRDQASSHSQREANKLKNRYGNIMAYDHSRVILPQSGEDPDTQYINANWIDGYRKEKTYIASQGPVPNSFISFWRMIWSQNVETIVMVTHEVEKGRMKCHRYWPDPTSSPPVKRMQYGQITVSHLKSIPHKHFVVRTFDVQFGDEVRTIKHFAYTSWPDHGVPLTTQELLGFRNAIHASIERPEAPQVIHCSAGVGRTGTYIAIDRLMRSALDMGGGIDVDAVVKNMRMARNFMVQTEVQYMFIYRAVLDAILELLSGESSKAQAQEMEKAEREAYEKQMEAARKEEEARKAQEQAEIQEARRELLARTDNSADAAAQIVSMSIADRVKLLQNAEERWLVAYRQSMDEWAERNQFEAEVYDTTSALTPIQSRLEALQQKGLFDQSNHAN